MTTSCDLLIVGGGVLGLWTAWFAADAGLKVALVDKGAVGGGGSNGLLGALLPHLPNAMNEKKLFQLQALHELPQLAAAVQAQGGGDMGYRQVGRVMPIRLEGFLKRTTRCANEAPANWQLPDSAYRFEIVDPAPFDGWLNTQAAPLGVAYDNLSARAAPRRVTSALRAALAGRVAIIEGFEFGHFDEATGRAFSKDHSQSVMTPKLVLAAGYETYDLLAQLTTGRFGQGIKGHSALFRLAGVADKPILYDNGVYVVPHADGHVAVGSTSEEHWSDPHQVEEDKCCAFIEQAQTLCPPLKHAELSTYWAGVRPRSYAKEPIVGRLAYEREIYVLTGGFKISFGIAHRLARALVERISGAAVTIDLPPGYEVGYHFSEARRDGRL